MHVGLSARTNEGSLLRSALVPSLLALSLGGLAGCSKGCAGGGASGRDPLAHLSADVEAVVELQDLAALPELNATIESRFAEVIPASDLVAARAEVERALGFDPFSAEGLKKAGLPAEGRVAGGVSGQGSVWVFPVADAEKAKKTVTRLVEARTTAEKSEAEIEGVALTKYGRSFGEETAEVAAFAVEGGLGFLGLGPDAARLAARAALRKPEASVKTSPEYTALAKELGDRWLLRGVFPAGGESLERALKQAGNRTRVDIDEAAMKGVKSAGWTLDLTEEGLSAKGKLRLTGKALEQAKAVFAADGKASAGVRALALPQAILFAEVNGDAEELMKRIAPPGSRARTRLARLLSDLGMKSEDEVLSDLTGQGALAMGVGDLSEVSFKRLMGNPMSVAWTALALGVEAPEDFAKVTEEMKTKLDERGFAPKSLEVAGTSVTSVVQKADEDTILVQSFARPGAVVYSNEPIVTRAIIDAKADEDPLGGKAGVLVEARLGQLARQLRKFNVGELPVMFRAMITRGIDALTLFDRLSLRVHQQADGLTIDGSLSLAPRLQKK